MVLLGCHNWGHTHVWYLGDTYIKQFRELAYFIWKMISLHRLSLIELPLLLLYPVSSYCKIIHVFTEYPKNMKVNHHILQTQGIYFVLKDIRQMHTYYKHFEIINVRV